MDYEFTAKMWSKGQSGNPAGRVRDKPWRDALEWAAKQRKAGKGSPQQLRLAALAVVDAAVAGDVQAAKELGDRLDGKPQASLEVQQQVTVTHDRTAIIDAVREALAPARLDTGTPALSNTPDTLH